MMTVQGTYRNGIIEPTEPVEGRDGQKVLITFLEGANEPQEDMAAVDEADTLGQLIDRFSVETGIPDLAHEHDHYLHGTPRRGE